MNREQSFARRPRSKRSSVHSLVVPLLLALCVTGCRGILSDSSATGSTPSDRPDPDDPASPSAPVPASEREAGLYRLSVDEYVRTVAEVLGRNADFELSGIGSERGSHGFLSSPAVALVDARILEATANDLASTFVQDNNPCESDPTAACLSNAASTLAEAAFRRPLTTEEQQTLNVQIDDELAAGESADNVVRSIVSRILQGPELQYLVLRGSEPDPGTERRRLLDHELASRLSYALWRAPPDDALLTAAGDGSLTNVNDLRTQARRMLDHPHADYAIGTFVTEWLELYRFEQRTVSAERYPMFDDSLRAHILAEPRAFSAEVVLRDSGRLETLLTADFSYLNESLADIYGAAYDGDGSFARTSLPPERRGLLTQPAYLAAHSGSEWGDVIHRGVSLNRHILCQEIPEPPPGIDTNQTATEPLNTPRDRFPQDRIEACRGCHEPINQAGFGFERYDAIGAYHETWPDDGDTIDASGAFFLDGSRITFNDGVEAVGLLANSDQVHNCFSRHLFRFLLRRRELNSEEIDGLQQRFRDDGGDIRALILDIVTSESFTSRAGEQS